MKDDPELEINEEWSDESMSSRMRRRIASGKGKFLRISLAIFLVLFFVGGIFYFLSKRPISTEASHLQSKLTALEQKIAGIEKQLIELQGKTGPSGLDPDFLQRLDTLAQKIEALEKPKRLAVETKAKPTSPLKPVASGEKRYHTVQKGETLYRISKQYGISQEELRKLNNLSADQPLRTGRKLLISQRQSP